jgi:hypothetical protein
LAATAVAAQNIALDSGWQLIADPQAQYAVSTLPPSGRAVTVGLSWNAQFDDMRDYMGTAWYRVTISPPAVTPGGRYVLHFGAVDYLAEVFVNGVSVLKHEGGYTPFSADITSQLKPGKDEIVVKVYDPPMETKTSSGDPRYRYDEIPHGKQNWYVQNGGIWQAVRLEVKPAAYIESVHVTPRLDGGISVQVEKRGEVPQGSEPLSVKILAPDGGGLNGDFKLDGEYVFNSLSAAILKGRVSDPLLWSPDHPNLYTVVVTFGDDVRRVRFGFRSFEARDGKFYLNGQPFYMIAALDQDFYPATIYSAPPAAYMRDMMLKGKRLGLNMLRTHIKVPDPAYLDAADEVGMLIWYEIPSWNDEHHWTQEAAQRGERTFDEMVARDWNHPSIVIQSIINESWGADLKQKEQRDWLKAAYARAKEKTAALGRVIVDNSACCDNFHLKTDIADFHQYYSIPDHAEVWDKWTADFASRPRWLFSSFGDAEPTGKEPLVLSEFGNWGLQQLPKELPWWFDRDFGGREVTRPAGVLERFHQYKFDRLFKDFNKLAVATEWHQFESLKHEVEDIRSHPSIQGYVITEFTDINWEVNGLMDMWRNPKVYAEELAKIQQADVISFRLATHNVQDGHVQVVPVVSHYSAADLRGATLAWGMGASDEKAVYITQPIQQGEVVELPPITVEAWAVKDNVKGPLHAVLKDSKKKRIAESSTELYAYTPGKGPSCAICRELIAHGPSSGKMDGVHVTSHLDKNALAILASGGRVLLLADSKDALTSSKFKLAARSGSDLDGNWVTNFNWADIDHAPFNAVPFNKILGWEAAAVTPEYILQGIAPENYDDVLSGITYGWLNNNAALAARFKAGKGLLFVTTFRFDKYGVDPYATHLLNAMIDYVAHTKDIPKLEWSE